MASAFVPSFLPSAFGVGIAWFLLFSISISLTVGYFPYCRTTVAMTARISSTVDPVVHSSGANPASERASPHRAQWLPRHSCSAMPVSVWNRLTPTGSPELRAAILRISFGMSCLSFILWLGSPCHHWFPRIVPLKSSVWGIAVRFSLRGRYCLPR